MKLPAPSKVKISSLATTWNKNEEEILEMAADRHLELGAVVAGRFMKDNVEDHSLDFKIEDPRIIRVIAANRCRKKTIFVEETTDGVRYYTSGMLKRYDVLPPNTGIIEWDDLYVPLSSALKVDGQSQHRLVIEEALAWINRHETLTSKDFSSWLHAKYPPISARVASKLFTFLNLQNL